MSIYDVNFSTYFETDITWTTKIIFQVNIFD